MKLTNSLTRENVEIPKKIHMYVCGITPYQNIHLGHLRTLIIFNSLFRFLKLSGKDVVYQSNFTDVDDKIITKAVSQNITPEIIVKKVISKWNHVIDCMNIDYPDYISRTTNHFDLIYSSCQTLLKKNLAYENDDSIIFSIQNLEKKGFLYPKFKASEVLQDKNDRDFAIWKKKVKNENPLEKEYKNGRPGWHVQCSSFLIDKADKDRFIIHGGGTDLKFPHHANEIAINEGLIGKEFVDLWLHVGLVRDSQKIKMSNSLNNTLSSDEVIKKYSRQVIKWYILSHVFTKPLEFNEEGLKSSAREVSILATISDKIFSYQPKITMNSSGDRNMRILLKYSKEIFGALNTNFSTHRSLDIICEFRKYLGKLSLDSVSFEEYEIIKLILYRISYVFDVLPLKINSLELSEKKKEKNIKSLTIEDINKLEKVREKLRSLKMFSDADSLRDISEKSLGSKIQDTKATKNQ